MYSLLQLVTRFGVHIVFLILQIVCFYFIVSYNKNQKEIFINSSNVYVGKINAFTAEIRDFVNIGVINDSLKRENATLIENLIRIEYLNEIVPEYSDSLLRYRVIASSVCNNTFHQKNNHITLCKGSLEGIRSGMGVLSASGIVGIVRNTSPHFAHVISLLHSQTRISCAVKSRNAYGSLVWDGKDPRYMTLESVPKFESVAIGDTVETSGYSTVFPKGLLVGRVIDSKPKPGSNNYDIKVKLFSTPGNIKYAYVIQNFLADEQNNLEKEIKNE